ncbi:mannonate dehydratase [Halococcus salifodinae]|uniref:mannonate dehydratase n=1 Tax=Halococcus salifodinae DSM 8989 TaxID=1227456 RepID=M0N9Q5_9EURY|nr:mannonate dehydratase [Halococcus salifodinae]EMA54308.1 Mannonate dehydratase [Halococcus salifodinae DSM 8989]
MVEPALILPPEPDDRWKLATQMGVEKAVVHPLEIGEDKRFWKFEELRGMVNWFEGVDLEVAVIEGSVPITDRTRLGLEGRDEEIETFKQFLRDCGELGIPTVCYDWMASVRWARTDVHIEIRGGSLTSGFDLDRMEGLPEGRSPVDVTHEELWGNLEYFLEEVVPVAEEAGVKLGLHPDDPPREELAGIPRIINSVEAYDRVLDIVDSPHNGVTFGQGNFAAMGADIPEAIRHFGDRIVFAHFRDVEGDADGFVETWHDDGPTDMVEAMRAYHEVDFDGVIRPDHVPTMAGEQNDNPGYETKGRLFTIGYMKGLLESVEKER